MAHRITRKSSLLENLFDYEGFLSILKYYVDMNCFVVPSDPTKIWLPIYHHHRSAIIYDLEKKYGHVRKWDLLKKYHDLEKKSGTNPLLIENLGFYDIFVPVWRKGKWIGTLVTGPFADHELTYEGLQTSWHQLSGQKASSENAGFREFSRVALETPVLEGPVLQAFREALQIFSGILTHEEKKFSRRRIQELVVNVFSKRLAHSFWMDWALGLPTRQTTSEWKLDIQNLEWVRNEIGLTRIPTTVITVIPAKNIGKKTDAIEEMIRVYHFQRQSFTFAQTLPETVGGKLENYGAVFVTSADPAKSFPQRRRQIMETVGRIQRFAENELGGPVLMGIGESVAPGDGLNESYRQSVLALHLGRQSGKKLVFFNKASEPEIEGLLGLKRLLMHLKRQFETASFSGMEALLDSFLKQVLILSFQNPDEIRMHLQYSLVLLMEAFRDKTHLAEREAEEIQDRLILSLEKTTTTHELILAFKAALENLLLLSKGRKAIGEVQSIEKIREYLAAHFHQPLRIARLSKMAGISVSTFGRRFKKHTGVGLEVYLQNLRLDEGARLLKHGNLAVAQIARKIGFTSVSYFIHLFQKKRGTSPQKYRQKIRGA